MASEFAKYQQKVARKKSAPTPTVKIGEAKPPERLPTPERKRH